MAEATATPTVMVVDDVPGIRQAISRVLEGRGLQVVAMARNGEEALAMARERRPDIVLLDVVMPILQGYEALPELRKVLPEAVIIMLTSTSERNLILECRRHGANGFIIKQDGMQEVLYERVMGVWNKRQRESGGHPTQG